MKKILLFSLPILVAAMTAAAQTVVQPQAQNLQQKVQEIRQGATQSIQALGKEAIQQFQKQRAEAQQQIQQKREEVKNTIEVKRAELKTTIEQKKQELETKLKTVRDEAKKQAVGRIFANLNALNEKTTNHLLNVVDQIESVLDRVKSRTDKAEANSLNVSSVRTVIAAATISIGTARTAIQQQAGKSYSVAVTDEATLRQAGQTAREQLRSDLKAAEASVKAARDAVRVAAVALAQIPRVNEAEVEKSETGSTGSTQ
jgi:hypothetical protein